MSPTNCDYSVLTIMQENEEHKERKYQHKGNTCLAKRLSITI